MPSRLRILITNNTLAKPAGTELSALDYAAALRSRGHEVAAFSQHLGEIAERMRARDVLVADDPGSLPWRPQVIHGHHEWEATIAALRFPDVPVVSFCRGPHLWQEAPCLAPNAVLWAAVDEACRKRLIEKHGIAADKTELALNGIDLSRFQPRQPLPAKPAKALVFSNYASEENILPAIREACQAAGIELAAMGAAAGASHPQPEQVIGGFDIVFAKGKAALESLAAGCAVIVCDCDGIGPMVTVKNFEEARRQSFGTPCMTSPVTAAEASKRLAAYDAADAARVSAAVRSTCSLEATVDRLEQIYQRAISLPVKASTEEIALFASRFLASKTHAAKLGRKMQEIWNASREPGQPDELDALKADRLIDAFFHADAKQAKLIARAERWKAEAEKLRTAAKEPKQAGIGEKIRRFLPGKG